MSLPDLCLRRPESDTRRHVRGSIRGGGWRVAGKSRWTRLSDVRLSYRDADEVGQCLVFNACPNDFRLVCRVTYANRWTDGTLLVKHFLTHSEYDKHKWCKDCIPPEGDA